MDKRKKKWLRITCIVLAVILLLCLSYCAARNIECTYHDGGESEENISTQTPGKTECTTLPTEATMVPTEPEATIDTTPPAPVETLPQESTPLESTPPATEVNPSDQTATEPVHTHNYSATSTTAPTCTDQGYTIFTCSCGSSYKDSYTQAPGHNWGAWTVTKEATTSAAGEQIRTCVKCGTTESQTIAQLPAEAPSEPAGCQHDWEMKYYPEEGHYGEYYNVCKCGFRFDDPSEWGAHVEANLSEAVIYHTNWGSARDYIVDSPERYEWVCSKCGVVSNTQP